MTTPPPATTGHEAPPATAWQFAGLAGANAAAVAALYWNQAIAASVAADLRDSAAAWVSLVPFATLAGYAAGVGVIAFVPSACARLPVRLHLGLLAGALLGCGLAPGLPWLVLFSTLVGAGASVAQRLVAAAARLAGPTRAAAAIGTTIAAALLAVLGVRLGGGLLAEAFGWRTVLVLAAGCVAVPALPGQLASPAAREPATIPLPRDVLRSPVLAQAALQQAGLFAAYNAGWMTLLMELPAWQRLPAVICGGGSGLVAAALSGRLTSRFGPAGVAGAGAGAAMLAGGLLLPAAYAAPLGSARTLLLLGGMMLLDAGLQGALVANQARVQALLPAARTRLGALLTVCGALGGALGAGAAYWLWHRLGWTGAVAVAAVTGVLGAACSWPLARLRPLRPAGFVLGRRRTVPNAPAGTRRHGMSPAFLREASFVWRPETMSRSNTPACAEAGPNGPVPSLQAPAPAFPPLPVADDGLVRLGGQAPLFASHTASDDGKVRLGGQAPMFCPELIADAGLVRLGGQSPVL